MKTATALFLITDKNGGNIMVISIAIPCYKSAKTIEPVVNDIRAVFANQSKYDYQIILVNDYPFDETFDVITRLCYEDKKIVGVNLSKNFGQASAKMAALRFVKGDVLVFMDDDGQHPADGIIPLAEKVFEGYDVVYAYFKNKQHSGFKKITSKINSKLLEINGAKAKGVHMSSFYAISSFAVKQYEKYNSPFPAMGAYLNSLAGKTTEIEMEHKKRIDGESNYTLKRLLSLWLNGFTSFSIVPLKMISSLGIIIAVLGFLFGMFVIIKKLVMPNVSVGYTSTMAVLLLLGGLILFSLGFIGEYIGRIYMTVSDLQQFAIREIINAEDEK